MKPHSARYSTIQSGWRVRLICVTNRLIHLIKYNLFTQTRICLTLLQRVGKALLRTHFSDAQCGFKAIARRAAKHLLPLVEDKGWFFDTELLVLAERHGYRIFDLPVHWVENRDSHVKVFQTAADDLKGLWRLRRKI